MLLLFNNGLFYWKVSVTHRRLKLIHLRKSALALFLCTAGIWVDYVFNFSGYWQLSLLCTARVFSCSHFPDTNSLFDFLLDAYFCSCTTECMYNIMQMFAIPSDGFPSKKTFQHEEERGTLRRKISGEFSIVCVNVCALLTFLVC